MNPATPSDDPSIDDMTLRTLLRTADAHPYDLGPDGKTCGCGWGRPYPMPEGVTINAVHAAHLAAEQAAALRATERVAPGVEDVARALSEALRFDDIGEKPVRCGPGNWTTAAGAATEAIAALLAAQPTVAEVRAAELREAADIGPFTTPDSRWRTWLRDRADRIGGGA